MRKNNSSAQKSNLISKRSLLLYIRLTSRLPHPVTVTLVPAAVSWPMAGSDIGLTFPEEKSRGVIN
jgi:hypothetical protein